MKAIKQIMKKDHVPYRVPKRVQDVIPIKCMWSDGIFLVGTRYSKTFKFTDINYMVASQEAQKKLFLAYAALINSLDCGATTKITLNNRHLNRKNFADTVLMKLKNDYLDYYRMEYNDVIMSKATGGNGIIQEKYVTVSVCKKNIEDARAYFARVGAELTARFAALGAKVTEMDATEKLRVLHDFFRSGEEVYFRFDAQDMMRKGHDFRDYICPDSVEKHSDYLMLGGKYARVIYLKDYASFISDQLVTKLTDQSRSMMLSIDIIPVATDEAVREVERKMLGVETNITNWQRRQNANNNFSAIVPYDMEQQRRETKEYMTDLTSRDQRMMLSVLTIVHLADTKAELDADTDALLKVAADHMCQMAVLRYQQLDGLNTALPIGTRKIDTFRTLTTESLVNLKFENIDWEKSTISFFQKKTNKFLVLPLLPVVGEAIIDYLRNGRPQTDSKYIFVKHRPPFEQATSFYMVMKTVLENSGIKLKANSSRGLHILRHSLASELIRQGESYNTVSTILGHASIGSTNAYTHIDVDGLFKCALELTEVTAHDR